MTNEDKQKLRNFMLNGQQYPSHVKTREEQVLFDQEFNRLSDELNDYILKKQNDPPKLLSKVTGDFFALCRK